MKIFVNVILDGMYDLKYNYLITSLGHVILIEL